MEEYAAKIADQEALQVSLIDKYEEDYRSALVAIDEEAKGLIQDGREMEALMLCRQSLTKIVEVHEALASLYEIIFTNQEVLKRYESERLRQLGHELKPISEVLKTVNASAEDVDMYVLQELRTVGFQKSHWCVECGSQERLEYDHIIPVSKGGSNTERNIQLLCEKCNRGKAAAIQ